MVDYEKKYKDAMGMAEEIIRYYKEHNRGDENSIEDLEQIFPELRESEDEKIRKALIKGVECCKASGWTNFGNNVDIDVVLAWLEKQGTPAKLSEEEQNRFAKGVLSSCALSFIDYLDAHKYESKMCVSNGECEDIENAFHNAMWDRLHRYYCKYIEKQGEKPQGKSALEAINEEKVDNRNCVKPTSKVEPKFKVGDWVASNSCTGHILHIIDIDNRDYEIETPQGNTGVPTIAYIDNNFHLWSIKDAKDGDVLASDNSIFIFQEEYIAEKPVAYCGLMNGLFVKGENACWTNEKCHPATKEQRDLLFKRVNAAGYEWDDDKKELKKIHVIDEGKAEMDYCFTKMMAGEKVSPAWSEEDKNFMYDTLSNLTELKDRYGEVYGNVGKCIDWLKSLKDRVQPQPKQEWSEKDEEMCQETIDWFEKKCFPYALEEENPARESIKWLKSLKNRLPLVKNC